MLAGRFVCQIQEFLEVGGQQDFVFEKEAGLFQSQHRGQIIGGRRWEDQAPARAGA